MLLASGTALSDEYERAGRGRMLAGMMGVCHAKSLLLWRGGRLELLTGSSSYTTSSRANREWSFCLALLQDDPEARAISPWAEDIVSSSLAWMRGAFPTKVAPLRTKRPLKVMALYPYTINPILFMNLKPF